MKKEDLSKLEALLSQFFNEYDINKTHFTQRNKIGKLIKENLIRFGRWRSPKRRSSAPLNDRMIANLYRETKKNKGETKKNKDEDCPF